MHVPSAGATSAYGGGGGAAAGRLPTALEQRETSPLLPLLPILTRVLPAAMSSRPSSVLLPRSAAPRYRALPSPPMQQSLLPTPPQRLAIAAGPSAPLSPPLDEATVEDLLRAVEQKFLLLILPR